MRPLLLILLASGALSCKGSVEENACSDLVSLVCNACGESSFPCERELQTKRDYYETRASEGECEELHERAKHYIARDGEELYCLERTKSKFMNNAPGSAEQLRKLQEREEKLRSQH